MTVNISKFIKRCETLLLRTKNPNKTQNIKYIESSEVNEGFQIDLIQLPDYLHLEKRYLCSCVDHQSKFRCSRLLKANKKEVLSAIKKYLV